MDATNTRLSLDRITHNPYQPRKRFDSDELTQLCESIKTHGVLQPLVVRQQGDNYQLIAGERRLRAAEAAGLNEVPVHVVDFNDQQVFEAALVENIQRADLNAIEKAQGFKEYIERFGLSNEQLGAKLGLDRTTISNLIGLLHLPTDVQDAVRHGQISMGHAKVIKGIGSAAKQSAMCREVIVKSLSVHALEQVVKTQKQDSPEKPARPDAAPTAKTPHVSSLENDLRQRFACRVEIKVKAKEKGQIMIGFDSNEQFERIIELLNR